MVVFLIAKGAVRRMVQKFIWAYILMLEKLALSGSDGRGPPNICYTSL
jgi:hypothetical protein